MTPQPATRLSDHPLLLPLRRFAADEAGSATVEWVVGTAMAISMTLATMNSVESALASLSGTIKTHLESVQPVTFD